MARRFTRSGPTVLALNTWGGARSKAGRKPKGERAGVTHKVRPSLSCRVPVHVTTRLRRDLPSLRRPATYRVLERAFSAGADRFGFRLIEFSIQSNHLHFIAESRDRRALTRGMQGLLVRIARALNRHWGRRGKVFADRYHARQLRTPREVRIALVYVLHNARRHGVHLEGVDPYSSAPWFLDWAQIVGPKNRWKPTLRPRTWLLRDGWKRHGLIDVREAPAPRRHPP